MELQIFNLEEFWCSLILKEYVDIIKIPVEAWKEKDTVITGR